MDDGREARVVRTDADALVHDLDDGLRSLAHVRELDDSDVCGQERRETDSC